MASTYSSQYDKPNNGGSGGDPYAGDAQVQAQQEAQGTVPGKDIANPYESEEEKQKRLKAQLPDAKIDTSQPPQYYDPSAGQGGGAGINSPIQTGSQQTIAQTPMIAANGTVPPGAPYNPVSTYQPVAPPVGGTQQPQQNQPQQGGTTPHGINFSPNDTTEFKWTEFAKKVLGQGDAGTAASGAGWAANPQAASARNNLGSVVDQYNQEFGAHATPVGEDKIDFGDGRGPIDVISGGGNKSSFWFGSPQNPNGSSVAPAAPGGYSPAPTPTPAPTPAPGPTTPAPAPGAPPPVGSTQFSQYTPPTDPNQAGLNSLIGGILNGQTPQYTAGQTSKFTPAVDPNQGALSSLIGGILGGTAPQYTAGKTSQYTAPDTSAQTGQMNALVGQLASAPGPAQYTAPDQTAQNAGVNNLVSQISNANVDPYKAAQITQFKATGNPQVDALQNTQLNDILSSPVYGPDFVNKLNESQKEMILQRGKAGREADLQDAARRGVTDSGRTAAVARRRMDTETGDLLKSQRDTELSTTGANRQSILDALASSQGILGSRSAINQGNFASQLAGETAQAGENKSAFQSLLDTLAQKNQAATTASGVAAQQGSTASEQYRTGLAGQTAAFDQKAAAANAAGNAAKTTADIAGAGFQNTLSGETAANAERGKEYQSLLDALQQKNTAAGIGTAAANSAASIGQGNFASSLAGETAANAEKGREYQSLLDAVQQKNTAAEIGTAASTANANIASDTFRNKLAGETATEQSRQFNTGAQLNRDQFNQQTKQFDQNFIEQVRQFDAQLAQQMAQFNKSNELGWANNQQGYDIANLNSQNNLISLLMGGA